MSSTRQTISDLNVNPYWDDYKSERQFTQLLAVPGRVAQAREITQIQSTVKDIIKSVGDAIMQDGDIIEGCQPHITTTNNTKKVQISKGKIYMSGMVLPVEAQEVVILGEGTEIIGAKLVNYLITEDDTEYGQSLKDPATGYDNFNQAGCHRMMSKIEIRINDPAAKEIVTIVDGEISVKKQVPEYDTLTETLARRTRDESGSYIVYGLGVRIEPIYQTGTTESTQYNVVVEQGKAYVSGYELETGGARRLQNSRSQTTATTYRSHSFTLDKIVYPLEDDHLYVKKIDSVRGVKEINKSLTRGIDSFEIGSGDELYESTIVVSSSEGTYTKGTDYTVSKSGNTYHIVWVAGGQGPSEDYNVYYRYETTFTSNNYTLIKSEGSHCIKWLPTSVTETITRGSTGEDIVNNVADYDIISGASNPSLVSVFVHTTETLISYNYGTDYTFEESSTPGIYKVVWVSGGRAPTTGTNYSIVYHKKDNIPVNSGQSVDSNFTVTYQYYLARKDILCIKYDGSMEIIAGIPAPLEKTNLPEIPTDSLALAVLDSNPNGSAIPSAVEPIVVDNIGLTRFTMSDINRILNRLKVVEYDQAILSLNDEARNEETSNKKGIFTDPLIDFTRIGLNYNIQYVNGVKSQIDSSKPVFDMALDLSGNICYLPVISKNTEPTYDSSNSTTKKYNRLITLNSTGEDVILSQTSATTTFRVNPYSVFPQEPIVSVEPQTDSWFNDTEIRLDKEIVGGREEVTTSNRIVDNRPERTINNSNYSTQSKTSSYSTKIGVRNENTYVDSEVILKETPSVYMRQRELTVKGINFQSSLPGIVITMDGVNVTPTDATKVTVGTLDTTTHTITADSTGSVEAKFTIPNSILTGTREIKLKSNAPGYSSNEGSTIYVAEGLDRKVQRTYTSVVTVLMERITTTYLTSKYVDPVGQTFVLSKMQLLKGVDVYFSSKPASGTTPIVCELRGVENGMINSKVYAVKSLSPSEVIVNTTNPAEVQPTRFTFDDPVLLEKETEYAFVLKTTSDQYSIWVAELGESEVAGTNKGAKVTSNPYLTGVMMSSSNNSSWTVHQNTDIKFRLISDTYNTTSDIIFNNVDLSSDADKFSRVLLLADSIIPTGTSISWSYKLTGDSSYKRLTPYEMEYLSNLYTGISLKASLSRDDDISVSPIIALDTVSLTTSRYDNTNPSNNENIHGNYVSHLIQGLSPFTAVKVILDTFTDSDTTIEVKISVNNGDFDTYTSGTPTHKTITGTQWKESTYTFSGIPESPQSTACRICVKAKSTKAYKTPAFRRLRVIFS